MEFRIKCTMQRWMTAFGKIALAPSSNPGSPSMEMKPTSSMPRTFSSSKSASIDDDFLIQQPTNQGCLFCHSRHKNRIDCMTFGFVFGADTYVEAINKNEWIELFKGRLCQAASSSRTLSVIIEIFRVRCENHRYLRWYRQYHAGSYLWRTWIEPCLLMLLTSVVRFGTASWFKWGIAVSRRFDFNVSHRSFESFLTVSITAIYSIFGCVIIWFVAKVIIQFSLEHAFEDRSKDGFKRILDILRRLRIVSLNDRFSDCFARSGFFLLPLK